MREMNRDRDQPRESNLDDLDRALDAALSNYAVVEPRAGLAGRILANLHTQPMAARQAWWRWGLIGALAAIVIVAMTLAWKTGRSAHAPIANHATTTRQIRGPANPQAIASSEHLVGSPAPRAPHNAIALRKPASRAQALADADPKLNVFPSPQPLSEEELALARYVRNFPRDARLVAQEQETSEREVLAKMQALANESTESN